MAGGSAARAKTTVPDVDVKMALKYLRGAIDNFHPKAGELKTIGEPKVSNTTGGIVLKWGASKFLITAQVE